MIYKWSAILTIALLSACAGPTVLSTPNGCQLLVPDAWAQGVAAPDLPAGDTVGEWIAYADAVVGKLDVANGRYKDAREIENKCVARDSAAVRKATRSWLGRLFG